jgi:vWA-MoxR associated protein C-terminal domain/vWA-MoxR associated protein middle region (VMAP-M) 1/Trypsin-like peptidase domain
MSSSQAFESSIVRIFSGKNVVGAGFLISERHLLTCAHVVIAALKLPRNTLELPAGIVEFDFPLIAPGQRVMAKVVFWQPVNPGEVGEDIAVLEVSLAPLPSGAQSVRLVTTDKPSGHSFKIYGFPEDRDDGVWATGVLRGPQARQWVQMDGTMIQGYPIEQGFSGAPVWDESLAGVVGMAVAADLNREEAKVAFMIPSIILSQNWKGLTYVTLLNILAPYAASIIDNLTVAYARALPAGWTRAIPKILSEKIFDLDDMQPDQKGYSPMLKFVAALVSDCQISQQLSQKLREWAENQPLEFRNILEQATEVETANKKSKNSYLMMVVDRSRSTNQQMGDRYTVKAWFIPDEQVYKRQSGTGAIRLTIPGEIAEAEKTFTCAELRSLLPALLDESGKQYLLQNLTIELFLPAELLNEPVDLWVMDDDSDLPETIGCLHHLVIRSSERLHPTYLSRYGGFWKNKWNEMPRPGETLATDRLILGDNANPNAISQQLKQPNTIGLKFVQEPLRVGKNSTFAALQAAAAPVAIWLRQPLPDINQSTTIDDLLNCCPHGLSEVVKQQRQLAFSEDPDSHMGHHLALLWEDFDRLPPDLDFFMA